MITRSPAVEGLVYAMLFSEGVSLRGFGVSLEVARTMSGASKRYAGETSKRSDCKDKTAGGDTPVMAFFLNDKGRANRLHYRAIWFRI